jgi:hypothetical protein
LKRQTKSNGSNGGKVDLESTLRRGLSPQGLYITGGIGILTKKISSIHLWSIARITYLIHSTLLSQTWFYIAFPNTELQKEGGNKAGILAMIDYMNKHNIPMSSIPEQTRKYLEGEKNVSLGYWFAVLASNRQAEHDKVFGDEEFPGDDSLF